jgi:hypothetical protein
MTSDNIPTSIWEAEERWGITASEPRLEVQPTGQRPLLPEAVRRERLHDSVNKLREVMQRYAHRLTLEKLNISEHYVSRHIKIILVFAAGQYSISLRLKCYYVLIKPSYFRERAF